MNIYRAGCHGCIYCDSQCSCYQIEEFDIALITKSDLVTRDIDILEDIKKHKS